MVLIKNLTQSQINSVVDNFKGEVITNADTNRLMFNTGTEFTYLVYSDLNNVITGLAGISATNITGTLQTAAQPNITSLGTLTGLTVNNNLSLPQHNGIDKGLTLGGDLVTSSAEQLNYVNTTPGEAEAGKALVLDDNKSIIGLTNIETDNLTVNGTLVTSSAIELNYVDVDTLGVAQASKALVVDADRNITNINTLEADFIQVNGTLVTSSAIELNYVDVDTLGVAQASKALVVDANRNIGNLNNVTAVNLTGTLQTAAQPNITSVGDLTGLNVDGVASVDSLIVNGVPLDAFKTDSLKMRVYSTNDFSGRVVKADIIPTIDFTDYEPVSGLTENYSMEIWGYVRPLYTENYTFSITSNDKFRLWINNELVRFDWTDGDDTNLQTAAIPLVANRWYPIYVQHVQSIETQRLVIRWSSATQTSQPLPANCLAYDDKNLPVVARQTYIQDAVNVYDSTNTNVSTISTNSSGDFNISSASSNVNISGHNGNNVGLRLNNVLVTATASELNYVDTTVGVGAGTKAVVLNANKDYAGVRNFTTEGNMGINSSAPSKQLEINSTTGDVLRLTRDSNDGNAINFADMNIDADGKLIINSSGDETIIHSSDSFNVAGHNGSTIGLKLNNVLVTSTATELNYVDTTPGSAQATKALVVDGSKNISDINVISTSELTAISTADSTSTTTGAITTAGGVGIAKNLNVGGIAKVLDTTNSSSYTSGALVVSGGVGIQKGVYIGDVEGEGYLNLKGNADVSGAVNIGGVVNMDNTTQSTSITSGALVVDGGVGIAKRLNVGEILEVNGNTSLKSNVTVDGPSLRIPTGDTASRPVGVLGQIRYNSETSQFEGFGAGNSWGSLGGVSDVDQDTKILAETAAGEDDDQLRFFNAGEESMRLTSSGLLGLGTTTPSKQLEINSSTGDVLRLTYDDADGNATNFVDMNVSADGKLTINSSGDEVIIHSSDNFNIAGHNGSSLGLRLNGVLVTATASELNYVDTTQGTAEASKALVLNSSRNISNINNIFSTGNGNFAGSVTTSNLLLSSLDELDYASFVVNSNYISQRTNTGFRWNTGADPNGAGTTIMELDSVLSLTVPQSLENTTDSSSTTTGALVVAGGVGIAKSVNVGQNLNVDGNVDVDGPSLRIPVGNTLARPAGQLGQIRYNSETSQFEGFGAGNSWGSLGGVTDVDQDTKILAETAAGEDDDQLRFFNAGLESMRLTSDNKLGLGTTNPAKKLEINSATGDVLRLTYNDTDGSAVNYVDFSVSNSGNLTINSVGETTFIKDTNNLDIAGHNGSTIGLRLAGILVTSTASELNYVDTTPGAAEASKALVVNSGRNISNINALSTSTLTAISTDDSSSIITGAITTAGGVGIAKNLNVGGIATVTNLTDSSSSTTGALIVNGGVGIAKSLYIGETEGDGYFNLTGNADFDGNMAVSGIVSLDNTAESTSITTGALVVDGGVGIAKSVVIGQQLEVNGNVSLKSNVVVDGPSLRVPVGNTATRPVGVQGQIRYNSQTSQFEGFGAGNAWGSLGGVSDVDQDTRILAETAAGEDDDQLRFFNAGSETMRLTSTGLMGLGTTTPSKQLEINSSTGDVLRLTYDDNNGSATNFVDMNVSADGKLTINSSGDETTIHSSDSFNVAGHNGTTIGLKLAGVLVTATASELNYVDTTPGTAEASKALVLDANRDIDNINVLTADTVNVSTFAAEDLSAENITTTGNVGINTSDLTYGLQVNHSAGNVLRLTFNDNSGSSPASRADFTMDNANNLSITASNSVNIAVHNGVDTGLRLAGTLVTATATELNYVDTTPGTAEPSKALVLNSSKDITGINSISMNSLNLTHDSAVVDTVGSPLTITRTTSGTPANGLGVGMSFRVENSANSNVEFGNVAVVSSDITAGSEDGQLVVNLLTNGVMTECLRLNKENLYVEQLFETSDRRVKENFEEVSLQETYNNIMNLKLTKYNYIGHNTIHTGLIAQEVEEIIPSAVNTEDRNGIEDFKSVSNREVTNTLLGAVQYLAQKLETLQAEFEAYKQAHS